MRNVIAYFVKYPVTGNVLMVAIIVFGVFGYINLRSSFFPQYESQTIVINAVYPGASPEEVEEGIVVKVEENLQGISGIYKTSSTASENQGQVIVELSRGFDVDIVLQDVKNAVDRVSSFPDGMENLVVFKQEPMNLAIAFSIYGDVDLKTLKERAQKVEEKLLAVDGISQIELAGFPPEEIEVAFMEEQLRAYQLSFEQAAQAVASANIEITGGTIKTETEELLVRIDNKGYHADDLKNIVVKATPDGRIVRLDDIAKVSDRWADQANKRMMNGKPSVVLTLSNTNEEDILFITGYVNDFIDQFNRENSVLQAAVIFDGSINLQGRLDLLKKNGRIGALLVFFFLSLFLRMRLAFWVALSIPISFLGMFMVASFTDLTINVMSLFGMILVIGILVDDGIVIGENIYQHYEEGKNPLQAAIDGTMEVLGAVTSAVLTTVVAFSTFFFLDGRLGDFAPDLAIVVIFTLLFSLVEGAFILPAHIAHSRDLHLRGKKKNWVDQVTTTLSDRLDKVMKYMRDNWYAPVLRFSLANKALSLAIPTALFLITIGALAGGVIKFTFFPFIERDEITVTLEFPAGVRQEITEKWLQHIEDAAWELSSEYKTEREDNEHIVLNVEQQVRKKNFGQLNIILMNGEQRNIKVLEIRRKLKRKVGQIPGADKLSYGVRTPFGKPVSISLQGSDIAELESAKEELKAELNQITALTDVLSNDQVGPREVKLQLKDKAYLLGLNLGMVAQQVRQGFFGYEVQRLQRGEDEVKIWVRYDEQNRSSLGDLEDMRIRTPDGRAIPLQEIADYHIERGVMEINRLHGKREIRVEADVSGTNVSATDVLLEVEEDILPDILAKHPSVTYTFEGQSAESAKTAKSGKAVLPVILALMLAIITLGFRSFFQAVMVLMIVPLGIIGVGWGHWLHGSIISLLSGFGIIALIGIMVNDSLVLVTAMNNLLRKGKTFREAVYQAALSRFRPIVLTSTTTIAGLAPLILERSFQAQFLIPMAIAVAYGLVIATYTTLIVLPIQLTILNRVKMYAIWLWTGEKPSPESVEPAVIETKYANVDED